MEQPDNTQLSPLLIDGPPWEKKHEIGFFVAFVETLKAFLLHPGRTFSVMRRKAGLGDALVYTVAIQVFTFLWMFAVGGVTPEMLLPQDPAIRELIQLPDNFSRTLVLIYPVTVMLLQFVSAFSVHLVLQWRKLQVYDFGLVFRIFAYASGTGAVLLLIPAIGGLLSLVMTIYLSYVGIRTIYGMPPAAFTLLALAALIVTVGIYIILILLVSFVMIIFSFLI